MPPKPAKKPAAAASAGPSAASGRLPQHTLAVVTWEDAAFDLDKDPGTHLMQTVGYIMRQTKDIVVVAGESSVEMDYFRSYTAIPAGMIRLIRPLQAS